MPKKELRTFDRYRYGKRSFLYSGDRFRTSGGPFYLTKDDDGQRIRIPMNEPGVFVFRRYCEYGASKWIEAYREKHGVFVIYVGRARKSPNVEGLRLRPHNIRLVTGRKRTRKCPEATWFQKSLFDT